MELVVGAMGSLIPKLKDLLTEEYKLQTGVKDQVGSLVRELESAHAALRKVAEVRPDQLDELVKIWAREVREASYGMEDILDTYLVHVEGSHNPADKESLMKGLAEKITKLFKKSKERHKIAGAIKKIKKNLQEVSERYGRYSASNIIVAKPAASLRTIDPRLTAMFIEAQIIGIDKSSADLISMVSPEGGDESNQKMKTVSVVGVGGLGKTTLAMAVSAKLKSMFGYGAFVPVGQDPDLKKVFRDILIDLDKAKYTKMKYTVWDEKQLIGELREVLGTKRYFVVIDDIWEPQSLDIIKSALVENNCGSRVIITTRKFEVAKEADEVYKLEPLSYDNSRKLFYTRLFGGEDKCPNYHPHEISDTILKKCGGIPLAIITMASFLLGKSRKEWTEVCNSPGFYQDNDRHMENTMHILSLSYYDLPSHLKSCFLYLSVFPEDYLIHKDSLIWKWIAEGFVEKKPGCGLFEVGEEYFHDLINRSMIQGVDSRVYGIMNGCRIHDMVLDLILSKSCEENFVSDDDGTLSQSRARRLASRYKILDLTQDIHVNLPQVRSYIVLQCDIDKWALHPRLKFIRVLALEGCRSSEYYYNFEYIGNLLHLRYLGIRDLMINKLPEGIGSLKFLQTLDLENVGFRELPCSIGMLTQLVCLRLGAREVSAPDGVIRKLTSLEELQICVFGMDNKSKSQFVKDLGNLCELRVLNIDIRTIDESTQIYLMESLGSLLKLQHLTLGACYRSADLNAWDARVPFGDLRCLFLRSIDFPRLPSWINSAHLPSLTHLQIRVDSMGEQGLKALGSLPELCYLNLTTRSSTATITTSNNQADGYFQKMKSWVSFDSAVHFVANDGLKASFTIFNSTGMDIIGTSRKKANCRVIVPATVVMPKLEKLEFGVSVLQLVERNISCEDLGLEYLLSIRKVRVRFFCRDAFEDDVEKQEAALRRTILVHPNHPTLQIIRWGKEKMKRGLRLAHGDSATE